MESHMCLDQSNVNKKQSKGLFAFKESDIPGALAKESTENNKLPLITEVATYGCGGNDIFKQKIFQLEYAELKTAAYNVNEELSHVASGGFDELIRQQLKDLKIDTSAAELFIEGEGQAFAIFLSLAIQYKPSIFDVYGTGYIAANMRNFEDQLESVKFRRLANSVLNLSKLNYIIERSFSRLWITVFDINSMDEKGVENWSNLLFEVEDKMNKLPFMSVRECFYAVLMERVEDAGLVYGFESPEYIEKLKAYDELVANNCFFSLLP